MRLRAALVGTVLLLVACGDDDGTAADTTSTTSEAGVGPTGGVCPDDAPIPSDVDEVLVAPLPFDGDGDGVEDVLSAYPADGQWWLHVEWAAGGTAAVVVDEASEMSGIRPLGGHDLGGDGADEAWVAIAGPASGSMIGIYRADGCSLVPVGDAESGEAFSFTVTASIGTVTGATCDGVGDLDLFLGQLGEGDEYRVRLTPYTYADGQLVAGPDDSGSSDLAGSAEHSTLGCGDLASVL